MASDSSSSNSSDPPNVSQESKGSSVSTSFREEYEDLLRYAVVTPKFDGHIKGVLLKGERERQTGPGIHSVEVSHLDMPEQEHEEDTPTVTSQSPQLTPIHTGHTSIPLPTHVPNHHSHTHIPPVSSSNTEVNRLEGQLDVWCNDLKRNILAEFEQSLLRGKEQYRNEMTHELHKLTGEKDQLQLQLERNKSLLTTYEQTVLRKDEIIQSLTKSLQKQKDRINLSRSFSVWRARHNDDKREAFVSVIATKHYRTCLQKQVLRSWFGLIQYKWRQRVQKACQLRAQETCQQLKQCHLDELNQVQQLLEEKQDIITKLCQERDVFGENMKKAFMRGVCALNMETMNVFNSTPTSYHDDQPLPSMTPRDCYEEQREEERRESTTQTKRQPNIRIERHLH